MINPKQYGPNEVKITHYPSHNNMYVAGSKIRVYIEKLIGVKNNQLVPIEDPGAKPYLLVSIQRSKNGKIWQYAVTEDDYYTIEECFRGDCVDRCRLRSQYLNGEHYSYKISDNTKHPKLTEMHREVAKRVISDYLKEKVKANS